LKSFPNHLREKTISSIRSYNLEVSLKEQKSALVHLSSMPIRLHLQTTQKCNFHCIMCIRQQLNKQIDNACMDNTLVRKIGHEGFPYAQSFDLSVSGEPLMAKNLQETFNLSNFYKIPINMTTNGSLLSSPDIQPKLLSSLGILSVSLDAAFPETLKKIRPEAQFESIINSIKNLMLMRSKHNAEKSFKLIISAVLMRLNIEELPDMVKLTKTLGAEIFNATHMVVASPNLKKLSLLNYPELFNEYREKALRVAKALNQKISLPPPIPHISSIIEKNNDQILEFSESTPIRCPYSHTSMYISVSGNVLPCCNADPDIPVMGKIKHQSLSQIWNSKNYLELRNSLRTGQLTSYCRRCYIIADQINPTKQGLFKDELVPS